MCLKNLQLEAEQWNRDRQNIQGNWIMNNKDTVYEQLNRSIIIKHNTWSHIPACSYLINFAFCSQSLGLFLPMFLETGRLLFKHQVSKFRPNTGLEGPEEEYMCCSTLSLTSDLDGVSLQIHILAILPLGNTRCPLYRRPQGRSVRVRKI